MSEHLILPDAHVKPNTDNSRFIWAGKLAVDRRPDVIICLGDFADLPSLCSYDKGRKDFEGRRYREDILSVTDALSKFDRPFKIYNKLAKHNKKKAYLPRKVMLLGNHEDRIDRAIQLHAELDGTISTEDLKYREYGWEVIPYGKHIEIDGIFYAHYFATGVSGRPISGNTLANSLLSKQHCSCTVGHSHLLDYAVRSAPNGNKIMGLSAGCYFDHEEKYAEATQHLWWRGLAYKRILNRGHYDLELISLNSVKRLYDN